ncbi:MAG: Gfo/Idh/MocA family oxidoreductase [Fimbriimonadaceae bacterium]
MAKKTTRRDFLKTSTAVAVGATLGLPTIIKASQDKGKPRFAVIGAGGRGGSNLASAAQTGIVVAVAEVDLNTRIEVMKNHRDAASFEDYRTMLDAMHREVDGVVISTPDHHHAPAAAMAMRYGKHVYVEKPLTRTVGEARTLAKLARENKVHSQMGNQGTAVTSLRKVAKVVRDGTFGTVKEVHCWTDRAKGWWPQGVDRPLPVEDAPNTIDWDVWVGPAPFRRYAKGYHPFAWRGWWDFGSGALGDIGCHCINLPFMALDLRDPIAVRAETSGHNRDSFPVWSVVTYEFGKRGDRAPLNMYWYDGGKFPSQDLAPNVQYDSNGCLIVCSGGTVYCPGTYGEGARLVGGEAMPDTEVTVSPGHFEEFANACVGGPKPMGNIPDYSGPLTETTVLGNLAVWADGSRIEWDARNMRVKGSNEYDALVEPLYRAGWDL